MVWTNSGQMPVLLQKDLSEAEWIDDIVDGQAFKAMRRLCIRPFTRGHCGAWTREQPTPARVLPHDTNIGAILAGYL